VLNKGNERKMIQNQVFSFFFLFRFSCALKLNNLFDEIHRKGFIQGKPGQCLWQYCKTLNSLVNGLIPDDVGKKPIWSLKAAKYTRIPFCLNAGML